MTNSDLMKANFVDILFENRNKDYGAYALRKNYSKHLIAALGTGLLVTGLLVAAAISHTGQSKKISTGIDTKEEIVLRTIELPKEKIVEPEKPKQVVKQKPAPKVATVKYTTPVIKKDKDVKEQMVAVTEIEGKEIATATTDGKPADGTVIINKEPVKDAGTNEKPSEPAQPEFVSVQRDPEFPGGPEALKKFLARNLQTPDELEGGEKKVVRIKFQVGKDGAVNTFEIVTSGGEEFDEEVLRVCKKMPRWSPALQNGINVPVSYLLPVTFIGTE